MPPGLAAAARRRLRRRRATTVGASVVAASVALGLGVAMTMGGEAPDQVAAPAETHPLPDSGWPGSGIAAQARMEGVLAATEDGCFYLELDDGLHPLSLLWPQGWSWSERPDGTLVVLTDRGNPVLSPGDRIEFSGGFTTKEPAEPDPCGVGAGAMAPMNSVPRKLP